MSVLALASSSVTPAWADPDGDVGTKVDAFGNTVPLNHLPLPQMYRAGCSRRGNAVPNDLVPVVCPRADAGDVAAADDAAPAPGTGGSPTSAPGALDEPAPPVTGIDLAELVYADLVLPSWGVAHASPTYQLTGTPMWMWVTDWYSQVEVASAGTTSVTLRALPVWTEWDLYEGDLVCDGAGEKFEPGVSDVGEPSPCSWTFESTSFEMPGGVFPTSATVHWEVDWVASDGTSGVLPPRETSTPFTLEVREAQAVTD